MNSECCKVLSSAEWDCKELIWRDKPFLKSHYFSFFRVPVNLGKKIVEGIGKIEEAGLADEQMMLSRNDSLWGADLLIPIKSKTDVFDIEMVTGRFLTRLFEGHYGDMAKWICETKIWCRGKGFEPEELIFWYATCPKCDAQAAIIAGGRL